MSFSFSQSAGTIGLTTITVSATSRQELESLVENYTLSNGTKSLLMPIAQRAYVPTGKYISFKPSSFSFESSGGTGSLKVTSNDDWYINFGSWVYPNEVRGNGNTIVGIRVEANTGNTRTGNITGYCLSDSAQTASTSVSQVGSYVIPFLSVSPLKTSVNASGGTGFTLAVTSNQDWITYADARWVTMNTLSGSGDGSISFEVGENATDIVRESNIYVVSTASSLSAVSVVAQSAQTQEEPYIIVSPTTKRIGTSGGSFTVTVSSNTEWETAVVYDGQGRSWIALDKLNGYGDDTVEVRIDPDVQESISGRSAYISFYNTNENLKAEVNIRQYDIALNKIYYTSTDGNIVEPNNYEWIPTGWGATLISNTYNNGVGVITFDGDVTAIPGNAFSYKSTLNSVVVPESVLTIGGNAFSHTALEEFVVPDNVVSVGRQALYACDDLTEVTIGKSCTQFGEFTYDTVNKNQLQTLRVRTEYIPNNFLYTNGQSAYIVYSGCTLIIEDTVKTIGDSAFDDQKMGDLVLNTDSLESIGAYAFGTNHYSGGLVIPSGVTVDGTAFNGFDNLTSLEFWTSSLNERSIQIESLETLKLHPTGDSIYLFVSGYSLCYCYNLKHIYFYYTYQPQYISTPVFIGLPENGTLHYPSGVNYAGTINKLPNTWTAVADL